MSHTKRSTMILEGIDQSFDLEGDDRHLLIAVGEHTVLLDTGCPRSYQMPGGPDVIDILGETVHLESMPLSQAFLGEGLELLNLRFDALIGLDVMKTVAWRVDRNAGTVAAATEFTHEEDTVWVPMDTVLGPPICRLEDGTSAVVDTGAQISYRIGTIPPASEQVGEFLDWGPMLGQIPTTLWDSTLHINGLQMPIRYGTLPPDAEEDLAFVGLGWLLGSDLLRHFRLTLDFPRGRMGLRPLMSPAE